MIISKSAVNMTISNVPTNPDHGVSWRMVHMVYGLVGAWYMYGLVGHVSYGCYNTLTQFSQ